MVGCSSNKPKALPVLVNLGCGRRFLKGWVNIDFVSTDPAVQAHDLRKGIPLDDNTAGVVYHSHILEHFSRKDGIAFQKECYRVLKPGGVIRVAVPDLQQLAANYLQAIIVARQSPDDAMAQANYQWAVIELIDQMVRQTPGGEMLRYWQQPAIINESLVAERMGAEFTLWRAAWKNKLSEQPIAEPTKSKKSWLPAMRRKREAMGINMQETGELHKWMYDAYSLSAQLTAIGFVNVQQHSAFDSIIPNWEQYMELDVEDGKVRKPDSLFMEATKL